LFFKSLGALGLLLISAGILTKERKKQNVFYILGGVLLEIYSLHLGDIIFIILQIVFVMAAIYDLIKQNKKESQSR